MILLGLDTKYLIPNTKKEWQKNQNIPKTV
jgi:hypothetical protein